MATEKNQSTLPTSHAFVVQLHVASKPEAGLIKGRVEHLDTFQSTQFESMEELVAFMARTIAAVRTTRH